MIGQIHCLFKNDGNSLVQVLVAAGIASMVALGIAQMVSSQNREVKALGEKLLTKDIETQLKNRFSNSDYCSCVFNGKTFDMTATPPVIVAADQISRLRVGYVAGPPTCSEIATDFIPPVATEVAGSTMTISKIALGPLTQVVPGTYKADVDIGFANSIRPIKDIRTSIQFKIDISGGAGPTARPFVGCSGSAITLAVTPKGFCTPKVDWDNSSSLSCSAIPGYTFRLVSGVFKTIYRSSLCCYVPDHSGSPGWCSLPMEAWNGSFSGCGSGTADYDVFNMFGITSGVNETHQCCFIPKVPPGTGFTDIFSTDHIARDSIGVNDCGGPYPGYEKIYQNVVTGGMGRNVSCTWFSK